MAAGTSHRAFGHTSLDACFCFNLIVLSFELLSLIVCFFQFRYGPKQKGVMEDCSENWLLFLGRAAERRITPLNEVLQ